jgi:hypothetical protein
MDVQPLRDFEQVVEEVLTQLRRFTIQTVENRERIDRTMRNLRREFERLFQRLTGYSASAYLYDDDGSAVMLSPEEADRRRASRNVAQNASEPYAVYSKTEQPRVTKQLDQLFALLGDNDLLVRKRTILSRDKPLAKMPPYRPGTTHEFSMMLYLRNESWMRLFAIGAGSLDGALFTMDDQMRALWSEYGKTIVEDHDPPELTMTTSGDVVEADRFNAFDALFEPVRVIDYSPEELAAVVQARKLLDFYREMLREHVRQLKQTLEESYRRARQASVRVQQLEREKDELIDRRNRLREQLRIETRKDRAVLLERLIRTNQDELVAANEVLQSLQTSLANAKGRQGSRKPGVANNARVRLNEYLTARRFLIATYLERETIFLEYLASILRSRRDNRRLLRLLRPDYRETKSFNRERIDTRGIKQYLRERDRILERLYALEYPRHAREDRNGIVTPPASPPPPRATPQTGNPLLATPPALNPVANIASSSSTNITLNQVQGPTISVASPQRAALTLHRV